MGSLRRLRLMAIAIIVLVGCGAERPGPSGAASPSSVQGTTSTGSATGLSPSASPVPAASPTADPPPSETTAVVAYASSRFGYSIEYPAGWVVRAATDDWPTRGFPEPDGTTVDRFSATSDSPAWMLVSSLLLSDGETGAGVAIDAKDMDDVRIGEMDAELQLMCTVSEHVAVTVDGVAGRRRDLTSCFGRDNLIEVLVSNDVRLYLLAVIAPEPIDAASRSRFDRFVESFRIER